MSAASHPSAFNTQEALQSELDEIREEKRQLQQQLREIQIRRIQNRKILDAYAEELCHLRKTRKLLSSRDHDDVQLPLDNNLGSQRCGTE